MTFLASLARRWEADVWTEGPLVPDQGLAPRGTAPKNVGFELVIGPDGRLLEHRLLGAPHENPARFRVMHLPDIERTSGDAAAFLWDKTEYLLGATNVGTAKDPTAGQKDKTQRRHDLFVSHQNELIQDNPDEGLCAVLAFLDAWSPDRFADELSTEYLDRNDRVLNGVFRLDGDRHPDGTPRYVHERPAARALWTPVDPEPGNDAPTCLVDGRPTIPARLHFKIKGIGDKQTPIASVNKDAFSSHGWDTQKEKSRERKLLGSGQGIGLTAPVSPRAAHAYRTALNALLAKGGGGQSKLDRGTGVVGDTTVAFWAETTDGAPDRWAEAVAGATMGDPDPLAAIAGPPAEADRMAAGEENDAARRAREQTALDEIVAALAKGEPFETAQGRLDPGTTIHVLGLSPNEGRISVRFYHVASLEAFARNIDRHWRDMALDTLADYRPAPRTLVREAAVHRWDGTAKRWKVQKDAEPPKRLAGELLRAILEGTKYPETLTAAILLRIRSERGHVNDRRAAMLKAVFNRNHSKQHGGELMSGLDRIRETPGYLLGQLFALYEKAENESQTKLVNGKRERRERNATLRDRYFAAASAGPARVFPTLGNGHGHNMAKLRKRPEETFQKSHGYIEREVGRVMNGLPIDIPKTLSPPEQSEFIVGYWHMRTDRPLKSDDGNDDDADDLIETEELAQ